MQCVDLFIRYCVSYVIKRCSCKTLREKERERQGDRETGRQGDRETGRQGDRFFCELNILQDRHQPMTSGVVGGCSFPEGVGR